MAFLNIINGMVSHLLILRQAEILIGIGNIYQMMRYLMEFFRGGFSGTDIHMPVHLPAIGTHYLTAELPCQSEGQLSLTRGRGTDYRYQALRVLMVNVATRIFYPRQIPLLIPAGLLLPGSV